MAQNPPTFVPTPKAAPSALALLGAIGLIFAGFVLIFSGLEGVAVLGIVLMIVAIVLLVRKPPAEQRPPENVEELIRPYEEAWAAARASADDENCARCGDYLIKAARLWRPFRLDAIAWEVYSEVLRRLRNRPDLRPMVLEIGRAAYAARRRGALTVYDEQAIQNDISAHSA